MPFEVNVALVAGGFPQLKPPLGEQVSDFPYEDRSKVTVRVEDDNTLREVFDRAIAEFSIEYEEMWAEMDAPIEQVYFLAFFTPGDENGLPPDRWTYAHNLTTVDADGHARWGVPLDRATIADLVRAGELDLVDGDPLKPYLIIQPPAGNGVAIGWAAIYTALTIAANIDGALGFIERVKSSITAGRDAVERNFLKFADRGGTPAAVVRTASARPWTTEELSLLLDVPDTDVDPLLRLFGFELGEDGKWSPGEGEEARLLRLLDDEAFGTFSSLPKPELEFRTRVQYLFDEGERDPRPYFDEPEHGEDDEDDDDLSDFDNGLDDFDLSEEQRLPLELLTIECACDAEDCSATAKVVADPETDPKVVRFELRDAQGHFEFPSKFFEDLSIEVMFRLDDELNSDD